MAVAKSKIVKTLDFAEPESTPVQVAWSSDGKSIYYVTSSDAKNTLWRQTIEEDSPHMLADLGDKEVAHFALAPDDNAYIYTRGEWLYDAILLNGLR
jgi:Tol biopolymer transport system component